MKKHPLFGKSDEDCPYPDYPFVYNITKDSLPDDLKPFDPRTEAYRLQVSEAGIYVEGPTKASLVRASTTLGQLYDVVKDEKTKLTKLVFTRFPLSVSDEPRFGYRGLMVDTARNFVPGRVLMNIMLGMAWAKLNVLHWHITDNDSFPFKSRKYPNLADKAAFSSEEIYTQEEVKELLDYAENLGITIVPEIDMPGHSYALGHEEALRDIVTCYDCDIPWGTLPNHPIQGVYANSPLDPTMEKTYEYSQNMLEELNELFGK